MVIALSLLITSILSASDLKLVCTGGWESFLLQIDFDTGQIRYSPRDAKKPEIHQLPDHKKVGARVKTLVARIPKNLQRSFGEDVTRYFISFHDGEMVKEMTIGHLGPPDEELCTLLDEIVTDLKHNK